MSNFDLILDGTSIIDEILDEPINDYAAIYIKDKNSEKFAFFERFDTFWTWINNEGKFSYMFPENYILKDFLKDMKEKLGYNEETWNLRIYAEDLEMKKTISSFPGNLTNTLAFSIVELAKLGDFNKRMILEDEDNDIEESKIDEQHKYVSDCIYQIIELISAQHHTSESIAFCLKIIDTLLRNIPLTPISEDDKWIEIEEEDIEDMKPITGENVIKIEVNTRCPRIIKASYSDETIKYFDSAEKFFRVNDPENNNIYYEKELSSSEISLPWSYHPTDTVIIEPEELTDSYKSI